MAKRLKFDESGDTDELQALFDSIASEPAQPKLEVVEEQSDDSDSDELQALFDSVAEEFGDSSAGDGAGGGGTGIQMPAEDAAPGSSAAGDKAPGGDAMFNRIGIVEVKPSRASHLNKMVGEVFANDRVIRLGSLREKSQTIDVIKLLFGGAGAEH